MRGFVIFFLLLILNSITAYGRSELKADDYREGANNGNAVSQWALGVCYGYGYGVEQDWAQSVYLVDLSNESAYCLLPYRANNNVAYPVIHDKEYIFFSEDNATEHKEEVDEYTLTCNSGKERNDLFIIFSPNQYGKANTTDNENLRPRELSWKDFQKWLAKNRLRDKDMQVIQKIITISSK